LKLKNENEILKVEKERNGIELANKKYEA